MNSIVLLFFALIILSLTQQYNAQRVNEGASTSKDYDKSKEVPDNEKCALDNYVEGFMRFIVAAEFSRENMTDEVGGSFDEFLFYRSYFQNVFRFIRYGLSCAKNNEKLVPLHNQASRMGYFRRRVDQKFLEMMIGTCSKQFSLRVEMVYNVVDKLLSYIQHKTFNPDSCENKRSSGVSQYTKQALKRTLIRRNSTYCPAKILKLEESDRIYKNITLSRHNIIPISLLAKFYVIWFRSSLYSGFGANTTCPVTSRLIHWVNRLQEIEPIPDEPKRNFAYDFMSSNPYLNRVIKSLLSWTPDGNVFLGPTPEERGPLHPLFDRLDRFDDYAFEFHCEPIIGKDHYLDMIELYNRVHAYVYVYSNRKNLSDFDIALTGSQIIISMLLKFMGRGGVTPFDINQWEYRPLTNGELSRINKENRDMFTNKYFWAIKKPAKRPKRSLPQKSINKQKCYKIKDFSKRQWGKFINHLLTEFLKNQNAAWSCDFQHLFFSYQFSNETEDCQNKYFDTFLLSKLSYLDEWNDCINFNMEVPQEWCLAWRRFMLDDLREIETEQYNQDLEIFLSWLWQKVSTENSTVSRDQFSDKNSVCLRNPSSLACPSHCKSSSHGKDNWFTPPYYSTMILLQNHSNNTKMCSCPDDSASNNFNILNSPVFPPEYDLIIEYLKKFFSDPELHSKFGYVM